MTVSATARRDKLCPKDFKISATSLLVSSFAINILGLALPVMTLQVYDRILPNPGSGTLPVLVMGVCIAVLLEMVLRLARAYLLGWAGASYEHRMSCAAMKHMLWADLSRFHALGIGEHLHRMSAIGKLKDFYNGYAMITIFDLVFVPIFLAVIVYISGPLAYVPTAILMVFTLISLWQGQKLRAVLKARDEMDDERYNFLIESLEGVHTLKSFALENTFARRYETLEEESTLRNFRVTEATAATFNVGAVFSHFMVAAVITLGAVLALQGNITTGALIATVMLSGRMMQPIQRALALWAKYQDYILARQKAENLFDTPLNLTAANDDQPEREGSLVIENLSFRRNENEPNLLDDINFKARRGEIILLSAEHGAGKTALLELIAGIFPPSQGEILIDGQNTLRYLPQNLVRHVGFIQTEGVIFRGTIRDNMTCFGQVPDDQAQEMASLLKVSRDIAKLPSGFDTFLNGNSTDNVPPGLKQRIAMVRVLAPKPRIILFDSADRALDYEGYNLVYNLLARLKGKTTMVLVSDDLNIRGLADRFVKLENGKITERAGDEDIARHRQYKKV